MLLPLLTLLATSAFLPVSEIAHVSRQLADTFASAHRLRAVHDEPVLVTRRSGSAGAGRSAAARIAIEIACGFHLSGAARAALRGINLDIRPGATLAMVGPSGSGKTTLANLLLRFWDPTHGAITLDGCDLRQYQLDDLRGRIALVAQDTYLFNDTLRANVALAKPGAGEAEIMQALERAALADFVAALPARLDTKVGERGVQLSGGQRQRVAIARAFLKNAPVLILDEATSHLDAISEAQVRQALDRADARSHHHRHRPSPVDGARCRDDRRARCRAPGRSRHPCRAAGARRPLRRTGRPSARARPRRGVGSSNFSR